MNAPETRKITYREHRDSEPERILSGYSNISNPSNREILKRCQSVYGRRLKKVDFEETNFETLVTVYLEQSEDEILGYEIISSAMTSKHPVEQAALELNRMFPPPLASEQQAS